MAHNREDVFFTSPRATASFEGVTYRCDFAKVSVDCTSQTLAPRHRSGANTGVGSPSGTLNGVSVLRLYFAKHWRR
jgi:hypothetical protein